MAFDAWIEYYPKRIKCTNVELGIEFPAKRSECMVYGKTYRVPRDQVVVFFDEKFDYTYSNHRVPSVEPTPDVLKIRDEIERLTGTKYNFVLINRYIDGADGVGWHADDEPTIDQEKPIVSVSLGCLRDFDVRFTANPKAKKRYKLTHGDVVVMKPGSQSVLQHTIPKRSKDKCTTRVNLTFRCLKKSHDFPFI